jgi:hypothetical protein
MHFGSFSSHGFPSLILPAFFILSYIPPVVVLQQCTTFGPERSQLQMQGTPWIKTVLDKHRVAIAVCSQDEVQLTICQTPSWDVLYLKCVSACFVSAGATMQYQSCGNVPTVFSVYFHSAPVSDRILSWNMPVIQLPQSSTVHCIHFTIHSIALNSGLSTAPLPGT